MRKAQGTRKGAWCIATLFATIILSAFSADDGADLYQQASINGWVVYFHADVRQDAELYRSAKEHVEADLHIINRVLPPDALETLRTIPIWVDLSDKMFPGCVYHPSAEWLKENGYDTRKAGGVHIANARNYLSWTHEQPAMILHELCHAYHHQVLGYDRPEIREAYRKAVEEKRYEAVLTYGGTRAKAYAMNNDQEYFAELSEAYFWVNDFYPFVRGEIKEQDPVMFDVLEKVWGTGR